MSLGMARPNPLLQRTVTPSAAWPPAACLPSQRFAQLGAAELQRWASYSEAL